MRLGAAERCGGLSSWLELCHRAAMRTRWLSWAAPTGWCGAGTGVLVSFITACGAPASPAAPATPGEPAPEALPERLPLQAMTLRQARPQEQALAAQLRQDVEALVATGERNTGSEWGLAEATDHLAETLEKQLGLTVRREGFVSADGALAQNLVVELSGTDLAHEVVLVGARFDTLPGSKGADDNASGVAALLAVARHAAPAPRRRSLRLVWFSDAGSRQQPEQMGAWYHLKNQLAAKADDEEAEPAAKLRACIELHGLGAYSEREGSQGYPDGLPAGHPIAEFIEVQTVPQFAALHETFTATMGAHSTVLVKPTTTLEPDPAANMSAFRAFVEHNCPALLVHDTHRYRYPEFGTPADVVERLDFDRFARAVAALLPAIDRLTTPAASDPTSAPGKEAHDASDSDTNDQNQMP